MVDRFASRACLKTLGAAGIILAATPASAWAHTGVGTAHGIINGFAHPLLGWDHLLAMLAVGIYAAQRGGKAVWLLPVTFVSVMAIGGVLGMAGVMIPGVETGILTSLLVLGALIALAVRFPVMAGMALVALFAIFHGHAHGTEMPHAASALGYALGFCTATALLHIVGIALPTMLRRTIGERQLTWVRYTGAGISLAGLLLLFV